MRWFLFKNISWCDGRTIPPSRECLIHREISWQRNIYMVRINSTQQFYNWTATDNKTCKTLSRLLNTKGMFFKISIIYIECISSYELQSKWHRSYRSKWNLDMPIIFDWSITSSLLPRIYIAETYLSRIHAFTGEMTFFTTLVAWTRWPCTSFFPTYLCAYMPIQIDGVPY
jgi:hypothetical protein